MRNPLKSAARAVGDLVLLFVTALPGNSGNALRRHYWGKRLGSLGTGTVIERNVHFQQPEHIHIGERCLISAGCVLEAGKPAAMGRRIIRAVKDNPEEGILRIGDESHISYYSNLSGMGGLRIGNNCGVGAKNSIYSYTHVSHDPMLLYVKPMTIGNGCTIGTNSSLICVGDVTDGTVIRPNSFVSDVLAQKEDTSAP